MSPRYVDSTPFGLEKVVTTDLDLALKKRGASVVHDGRPGRPDIVITLPACAIVVELAMRSGADAASEYLAIKDHRDLVEFETGKTTHLLFSCLATPERIIRAIRDENATRQAARRKGRVLFLSLDYLQLVVKRLIQTAAAEFPAQRLADWFDAWEECGDDVTALEQVQRIVFGKDDEMRQIVEPIVRQRMQVEQEALRDDVARLEDLLRHINVTRTHAMHVLVYSMFVRLYEEKREAGGEENRFTVRGFLEYRQSMSAKARQEYEGRTLVHLIENEIALDDDVKAAGLLADVHIPREVTDDFVEKKLLPTLDKYRFRGTHLDALGAVFEALARRAEKDNRLGQFFTPEPIVRFAVDIARPGPTERVLDPAAGTGRFLSFSMEQMVARAEAGEVVGETASAVIKRIHKERLLGTDADSWIVTIAKMNMYIHGDGKSNILHENGLFLADLPVFKPTGKLDGQIDVCLTNPPLGEMNYVSYANNLASKGVRGLDNPTAWLRSRFPLLPGSYAEDKTIRENTKRVDDWSERERKAILDGNEGEERRARRMRAQAEQRRAQAQAILAAGTGMYAISGSTAKGGALFLAAIHDYLKVRRDVAAPEEWQGGRVAIVVDEAILNTPEYEETRRYIRRYYFIKAVFSFERDAFWYQARTTAKTSLLYLFRKPDPLVVQREPILFDHIEKIGFTRTGSPEESDLPRALAAYQQFEQAVRASYRGNRFNEDDARRRIDAATLGGMCRIQWQASPPEPTSRLDYAHEAARQVRAKLPADHLTLGYYVETVVRYPPEDHMGVYGFATVDRASGEVKAKGVAVTQYEPMELRMIQAEDIVLSGIDVVNGAVGFALPSVAGLVVSKEFYTLRVRENRTAEADPRYIALLLRTAHARELLGGLVTGTSNRTRIEDEAALLALPLAPLPPLREQERIAGEVDAAFERRRGTARDLEAAVAAANQSWIATGSSAADLSPSRGR
jgi:predicted RNA methylase